MRIKSILPPNIQYLLSALKGNVSHANKTWLYRDFVNWLLPSGITSFLLSIGYRYKGVHLSNKKLYNKHLNDKRCFVIGNGPSLKNMDLSLLKNEWTIGANSFYMHKDADESNLNYLCIGDPTFMEDNENNIKWHKLIEKKMPDTALLLNPVGSKIFKKYDIYSNHDIYYFHRGVSVQYYDEVNFNLTKPINNGVTTGSMLSIPLAIYLGFKEIILIGFDCNWLDNFEGSYHFYDKHKLYPIFDSSKADSRWPRYEDHLINALRDIMSHRLIAENTKKYKVDIKNATIGGRLDMYPRINYSEILF